MAKKVYRIAVVAQHVIQYQVGIWRRFASHPRLDPTVFFLDRVGVDGAVDPSMGGKMAWDTPMLDGYRHVFLKNLSPFRFSPFVGRINPTVFFHILFGGFDAVLVHGYASLSYWLALFAGRVSGATNVTRSEGTTLGASALCSGNMLANARDYVQGIHYGLADTVGYSSADNRDYCLTRGAREDQLFPFLCAVDNELLRETAAHARSRARVRQELGIADERFVVASVGRLVSRKRQRDLIRAVANRDDVTLLLIGDGPDRNTLEMLASETGARCVFAGFQNQSKVVETLQASDAFAIASDMDPSPKALSEALALGLPSLVSDRVGTAADLIQHGSNGFVFTCGSVRSLTQKLGLLLKSDLDAMSRAAKQKADEFSFDAAVEALVLRLDRISS